MSSTKHTPERKSRSGSYVPDDLRGARGGASERVVVRCSPELARAARRVSRERHVTLAEILERGVDAVEATHQSSGDE